MLKVLFPWKQNNTKKVLFAMEQVVNEEPSPEELPFEDLSLLPCHVCNRTFLPKPLKKHIPICEQALRKKRKPFDSLKQRVEGTDMAPFYQKSYLKKSSPEISSQAQAGDVYGNNKVSKWREKHFELQKTIKNAKGTKTDMSTNPPTSTSITPNRKATHLAATQASSNERCPVCDRSFGPKAFDRHVEFCKEQKNRVQVHKSPAVVQQAKERLEARINYRVPPLRQSKRSLVRDKYCPSSQTNLLLRSNSIGPGKSTTSLSTSVTTMASNRRQPISNNERNVEKNNKKEAASKMRLDRTIGDCGDTKELIKNENGNTKSFQTKRIIPAKKINKTEVNDGLQGITVSSLSVEKDKKLVTWKDTVKSQPKVTSSISLMTTTSNVKKHMVRKMNESESGSLRNLEKVPSLGKVIRSRLLMEKLNMFVSKKKSEEIERDYIESAEDLQALRPENTFLVKEKCSTGREFLKGNRLKEDLNHEDMLDFSELTHISEEGEVENDSPKNCPDFDAKGICKKKVSFAVDCYDDEYSLNITQDIEKTVEGEEKLTLPNKENVCYKYNTNSSEDVSGQEDAANNSDNEGQKYDSGDDTKTEDTSSLCLRLPLEGMESKVKLKNNDLDPDQKLKKNIKSFYEIMKTRRCTVAARREQLSLLESSKDIKFLVSSPGGNGDRLSPTASERTIFEKYEDSDVSEKVVGDFGVTNGDFKNEFNMTRDDPIENLVANQETSSAASGSNKIVTFKIASRQPKTWKRRKKQLKCHMCIKCFMRDVQNRKNRPLNKKEVNDIDELGLTNSENESVFDSPQILEEESFEKITKTSDDVVLRKSRSANSLKTGKLEVSTRKKHNYEKLSTRRISRSLPNIRLDGNKADTKSDNYRLSAENSFDNVVPRKRRKISATYLKAEKYEVEKNLKHNISKIRKRKEKEELPLILDYEKIGLGSSKTSRADILYVNEVFASSFTPERSELDSVDEYAGDGIQEYGDEELESWDAGEEELLKELERKDLLMQSESPTRLSRPRSNSFVDEETDNKIECVSLVESTKTLKNSSACTIVNRAPEENASVRSEIFPVLGNSHEISDSETVLEVEETAPSQKKMSVTRSKTVIDKVPCRLPRIIPPNKQSTPQRPLMASLRDELKLPAITNIFLARDAGVDANRLSNKLVQVPSKDAKALFSFCQQTSKMLVDNSSSFNSGDFAEDLREQLSSTTSTTPTNYDPFEKAHLQLMELIEDDNTSASSSLIGTCSTLSTPTIEFRPFVTAISTPKTTNKPSDDGSRGKRTSVIEPPYAFQDNRASRDLDQEFELLESLMNNNLDETSDRPGSNKTTSFQRLGEDIESIDPRLINEQDNLSIPERLPSDEPSPASKVEFELGERFSQERRPTRLLIKPTALIRPGQVRLAPEGSSAGSYSTKVKNKNKMRIDFSPESQKNKNRRLGTSSLSRQASLEVRKALAEEVVEVISTKEETFNINRTPTAEELYPDNPMMYEEFRKYEEMYRREKEGRSSSSKKQKKTADFGINIEDSNKTYADSAYGSLSRKQQMKEDESSDQLKEFGANKQSTATTPSERLPKYCHECGNKYPVPSAKFCVECGVKRLVL